VKRVRIEPTFESWREAARPLLSEHVSPAQIYWDDGLRPPLLDGLLSDSTQDGSTTRLSLPKAFVTLAPRVAAHRDHDRWDVLYRVAFRILHENRSLLDLASDPDVHRLHALDQDVRRDLHKMHAFVRFKEIDGRFLAWYNPDHHILPLATPFFVERFHTMRWSILTPEGSAHWDGSALTHGPGVDRSAGPSDDDLESLWRTYYGAMFNPARTNLKKMRADMPTRFWRDLPELRDLPRLLVHADDRVGSMLEAQRVAPSAAPFVPAVRDLDALREASRGCEGCELYAPATQTVFGEGAADATVVLVGEQPGDHEDLAGRPFVGPAGEVLDRALEAAGVDRGALYVTNAVKHFAYTERGKQRIHRTPKSVEVAACRPWLDAELATLQPRLIVALGATAARALLGARVQVLRDHGRFFQTRDGRAVLPTIHPSAVLRADASRQQELYAMLVSDLSVVTTHLDDARGACAPSTG
jgi:probable DNA metabolism protein